MQRSEKWFCRQLFPISIILLLASCTGDANSPENVPSKLQIESPARTIYSGGLLRFTAIVTFDNGHSSDVTGDVQWSTKQGDKGNISETGLFTAWNDVVGSETIRAFYKGLSAEIGIEITPRAVTLSSWPVIASVASGEAQQFEIVAQYHDISAAFVAEQANLSIRPGIAGTIAPNGIFQANTGMTGAETLHVKFQELEIESYIRVQSNYQSPVDLVSIPAGTFTMGDDNGFNNERPAHAVTVSSFQIGKYEVTNKEYTRYLNAAFEAGEITYTSGVIAAKKGPYAGYVYAKNLGSLQFPDQYIVYIDRGAGDAEFQVIAGFEEYPVVRVNWYGAAAFCRFYGLRLPTEAEWEMACRGGQQLEFGTETGSLDHDQANFDGYGGRDRFVGPAPVGSFAANPYGLHDMCGNAAEYVFDVYQANFYASSPGRDPIGPGPASVLGQIPGGLAVWRGGAWIHSPQLLRSSVRGVIIDQPDNSLLDQSIVGFRVARAVQ
ncbi:MAG: SUMF1/EgtB/PvdO family nonheme iron enzyme [bacterium]